MECVNKDLNVGACLASLVLGLGAWGKEGLWVVRRKRRVEGDRLSKATTWW